MGSIWKGGWHPEGKGGNKKESWRGDFKGVNTVAGWMGKGKDPSSAEQRENHVSQPLTSLKDPSTFGPPPKHINYHGQAAASPTASPERTASPQRPMPGRPPPAQIMPAPGPSSLGGALPRETIQYQTQAEREQQQAEEEEERPPGPYQVNTTGIDTRNLPKPPVRRVDGASPAPSPRSPAPPPRSAVAAPPKPAPRLPPRLPPRQNSRPDLNTPEPPPAYNEATATQYPAPDQGAMNRLGQAGVSVPGFDIGITGQLSQPPARSPRPTGLGAPQPSQLNELQSRFANMSKPSSSSSSSSSSNTQSEGTTWQQKQAAAATANKFHQDPSSVSFSDAKSAASTANNFRERHGDTVASGYQSAKGLSSNNKLSGYASSAANYNRSSPAPAGAPSASAAATASAAASKKAPPPPPPKKRELGGASASSDSFAPPPLPLSSKPR
ncbi:hypothetical protein BDV97DRAFT_378147 [Delphinella strobiligena]|nr:hypothetical protein BDV97DRAFT_378147 [Delphinella strobiligena]